MLNLRSENDRCTDTPYRDSKGRLFNTLVSFCYSFLRQPDR